MLHLGASLVFFSAVSAALVCDVHFQKIRPSETGSDADATDTDAPHWVFPGKISADEPLRVFLPGTGGHPSDVTFLLKSIANCNKPTIGLSYAFLTLPDAGRNQACEQKYGTDMAGRGKCLGDHHADAIWGGDSQPDLWNQIKPQSSISGRLALLLAHLDEQQPEQGWHAYLIDEGKVRWDRVVMGGHSQGSGHSGYMAQTTALRGAVLLSGPQDDSEVPSYWVDAASWATSRVVAAKHANEAAADVIGANWRRMAGALGWPNDGEPWDLGMGMSLPPYGPVVSQVPPAEVCSSRPHHTSMASDFNTPVLNGTVPGGDKQALYGLFLWPGLYDLAAGQAMIL